MNFDPTDSGKPAMRQWYAITDAATVVALGPHPDDKGAETAVKWFYIRGYIPETQKVIWVLDKDKLKALNLNIDALRLYKQGD